MKLSVEESRVGLWSVVTCGRGVTDVVTAIQEGERTSPTEGPDNGVDLLHEDLRVLEQSKQETQELSGPELRTTSLQETYLPIHSPT